MCCTDPLHRTPSPRFPRALCLWWHGAAICRDGAAIDLLPFAALAHNVVKNLIKEVHFFKTPKKLASKSSSLQLPKSNKVLPTKSPSKRRKPVVVTPDNDFMGKEAVKNKIRLPSALIEDSPYIKQRTEAITDKIMQAVAKESRVRVGVSTFNKKNTR